MAAAGSTLGALKDRAGCCRCPTGAPQEGPAQVAQGTLQSCLGTTMGELAETEALLSKEGLKVSRLEDQFTEQRERILCGYEELEQFLETEKRSRLGTLECQRMEALQAIEETLGRLQEQRRSLRSQMSEIASKHPQADVKLQEQQASLRSQISEIESKRQQTDVKLPKDHKEANNRSGNTNDANSFSEEDKGGEGKEEKELLLRSSEQPFDLLTEVIVGLEWRWGRSHFAVPVTLDPDPAHKCLALSEDGRRVKNTAKWPHIPNNSKRFSESRCVLAKEMFSSGRYYWEVQITRDGGWSVGVARESVSRKKEVAESPERGVWAVGRWHRKYLAYTSPPSPLYLRQRPLKLGVYLNYERGQLSVFNADTMEGLHTFAAAAFEEAVCPYFWVWEGTDLQLV